ncbi:RsmB/NOP family class I SAM-dependent RNA methyltransferase [Microbacterium pumilum]|uniref:Transcription antitermination factor NusB n=1 Tax=Microbacterium pumilum TaxID=344165 RepID=A0ABN2SL00_9MICO
MSGASDSRRIAYETLRAVHESDAYANLLLPKSIERGGLDTADAALATELTYGTLRRQGTYDAVIAIAADRPASEIDPGVLDALRLGVHQLLSTRVASHAAVNESVELARVAVGRGAAGFVNAVLRRVSRDTPGDWMTRVAESARSDDERLGLLFSHPVWVVRAFRRALAAEGRTDELEALLTADNAAPRVTMIALPGLAEVPDDARRTPYSPLGFRLGGGDPEATIRESGGRLRVQDEGSQLAALALSRAMPIAEGERWLDLCAGPGGKTAVLAAEALNHGAQLEANEISPARAGLVRQALTGVPLDVHVSEQDGRARADESPETYDRILVDAPCTGLGALRRRPEARWRKSPADLPELTQLQGELLSSAIGALKPGGIVAYITCSPHLGETAGVMAEARREWGEALEELDARSVVTEIASADLALPPQSDGSGRAQLWPHRHNTDAMSISLLRRV